MNFKKMLATFDMGLCADQLQREALFDLALLFVELDGVVTAEETSFIENWIEQSQWNSHLSKAEHQAQATERCQAAIKGNLVESFIKDKVKLLANTPLKDKAIEMAREIVMVDGELSEEENIALGYLTQYLR